MKKLLSLLLAFSACFALAACEDEETSNPPANPPAHTHEYASEWSKDADNHWHACTGTDCTEASDKAAHTWNDGVVEGATKTYTCTVCNQTKSEAVPTDYDVTAEEWLVALSLANEDNYKVNSVSELTTQTIEFDGVSVYFKTYMGGQLQIEGYRTKDGDKYYDIDCQTGKREECTKAEYDNARAMGFDVTFAYSDFVYDPTSKTYKADEIVLDLDGMTMTYSDVSIAFENKRFVAMTYSAYNDYLGDDSGDVTVTYGDVEEIAVPDLDVTEEEWNTAKSNFDSYTVPKTITYNAKDGSVSVVKIDGVNLSKHHVKESEGIDNWQVLTVEDGDYYRYNKTGDGAWTVYNDDQASWVDVYEQNIDNATPVVLVSYEYLEAREDCYYFAEGERTYKYYFIDGKLSCIEVGGNTNFSIYVNFDVPVIEAPELTVEASEWDLAFENLLDDTVAKTYVVSGTSSTTFVKMDGVSIFINTNDEGEYIYTTDGTNYYCYTRYYRNGVWDDWEVLTVSQTGYQQGYAIYGSLMLNDLVVKNDYNESNYVDGAYVYGDVSYSFENGKLIAYTSQTTTVSFNYDVPVIEIPQNATPRD